MENQYSLSLLYLATTTEEIASKNAVELDKNIFVFPYRKVGSHDNVFEGEVRSSVYGARPCVIKFATISEQNIRESEILTKLGSHTNVIAIIQSGIYHDVFGDIVYIALDKCHNENLRQYLVGRKNAGIEFDLSQAIDFAKQIIAGLVYIHVNNVIHMDLKPSNILISQNMRFIKIADFGLSIIVRCPKSKVFHKRQFGTNGYRPIESFGNGVVSQRTDIFSLGTVLLHLLSNGNEVFGCDTHMFIYNVTNEITNTSGLLVSNPNTTEHLIKCMVRKERCRRPTIWEVVDHPCWDGKEICCNIEYSGYDEVYDDARIDENAAGDAMEVPPTSLTIQREFLTKMREMGFHREPVIVLFDNESNRLLRFDHRNGSSTMMHDCPPIRAHSFKAISFGEYIYMFDDYHATYRLEYCDVAAKWERMNDWTEIPGYSVPDIVASSIAIFFIGSGDPPSKAVSKYDPSCDHYERLGDKPTATDWSGLVCNDEFLYCIGGYDSSRNPTNLVHRMNLETMKWTRVSSMHRGRRGCRCVEHLGNIYVVNDFHEKLTHALLEIEKYDPKVDQWTTLNFIKVEYWPTLLRAFLIDGNVLAVCEKRFYKYDLNMDEWSIVTSKKHLRVNEAALVKMSR